MAESIRQELGPLLSRMKELVLRALRSASSSTSYSLNQLNDDLKDLHDLIRLTEIRLLFDKVLSNIDNDWTPKGQIEKVVGFLCHDGYEDGDIEHIFFKYGNIPGVLKLHLVTSPRPSIFKKMEALPLELRKELATQINVEPIGSAALEWSKAPNRRITQKEKQAPATIPPASGNHIPNNTLQQVPSPFERSEPYQPIPVPPSSGHIINHLGPSVILKHNIVQWSSAKEQNLASNLQHRPAQSGQESSHLSAFGGSITDHQQLAWPNTPIIRKSSKKDLEVMLSSLNQHERNQIVLQEHNLSRDKTTRDLVARDENWCWMELPEVTMMTPWLLFLYEGSIAFDSGEVVSQSLEVYDNPQGCSRICLSRSSRVLVIYK